MPTTPETGSVAMGWSQIKRGDVVLGARDGLQYAVMKIMREGEQTRVDLSAVESASTFKAVPVSGTVRRVATATQVAERALAVAQVKLGGQVVAVREADSERGHACPEVFVDTGSLAAHLLLFHATTPTRNIDGSPSTYAQLDGEHRALHHDIDAGRPKDGTEPHFHDPDFNTRSA